MSFEYTIKAIPTMYNGVMFRSRLEATWAAFFDILAWDWEYEPFDMEGWTPDFLIKGSGGVRIFCEVKPVELSEDMVLSLPSCYDKMKFPPNAYKRNKSPETVDREIHYGENNPYAAAGAGDEEPFLKNPAHVTMAIGLSPFMGTPDDWVYGEYAAIGIFNEGDWGSALLSSRVGYNMWSSPTEWGLTSVDGAWADKTRCSPTHMSDKDILNSVICYSDADKFWKAAKNKVQKQYA